MNLDEEALAQLKPVPDYPNYCADKDGNIWSLWYHGQRDKPKLLKAYKTRRGYLKVTLWRNGKQNYRFVHRIILETFIGKCPDGYESLHSDGNKENNCLSNLRWGTAIENQKEKILHGNIARGERAGPSKLNEYQVKQILKMNGGRQTIADLFGVSYGAIRAIKTGRTWKHIAKEN